MKLSCAELMQRGKKYKMRYKNLETKFVEIFETMRCSSRREEEIVPEEKKKLKVQMKLKLT